MVKRKNRKLHILISMLCISIALIIGIFAISFLGGGEEDTKFSKNTAHYISSQDEIAEVSELNKTYVSISDFTTRSGATAVLTSTPSKSSYISISSAEELYVFSYICNAYQDFLGYNYELVNNIDYSSMSANYPFLLVGASIAFSGTFNGNGFEISNLRLANLTDANITNFNGTGINYSNINYYAMFVKNSGTISKLGLIDTIININCGSSATNLEYVAPLCGENSGTIEYAYVKQSTAFKTATIQDNAIKNEAGITCEGDYVVSGAVSINNGEFKDSYTAYTVLVNITVTSIASWHEILSENSGKSSNLYYYNYTLLSLDYTEGAETEKPGYNTYWLPYVDSRNHVAGTNFTADTDELTTNVAASSSTWYTYKSYGTAQQANLSSVIVSPIQRGLGYDSDTKTFTIEDEFDYIYMYELMNSNSYFASSAVTYEIENDIDLQYVPSTTYAYSDAISATITGVSDSNRRTTILTDGSYSSYPTIMNAYVYNSVTTEGVECYGVFPYLTGTVSNLNFYFKDTITTENLSTTTNIRAVGTVAGYAEGATIDSVNVSATIDLSSAGRVYCGGITGILGGSGTISNVTTAGSINGGTINTISNDTISDFVDGIAIGGVVGYIITSYGSVDTALNAMTITTPNNSTGVNISVGGVVGAGYTENALNLANKANINYVGSYSKAYVAGVIGNHLGLSTQVSGFHNQGTITVTGTATNIYLAGVTNANIQTTSGTISASALKNSHSKYLYYADSFTNGGIITVNSSVTYYAGVANILSANGFISEISGFYNLAYYYSGASNTKTYIGSSSLDIYLVQTFGAVICTNASTDSGFINATTLYNFRSYNFTTSAAISRNVIYTGAITGNYVTSEDVRNEGNLSFVITKNITGNVIISGLLQEITTGNTAKSLYNGGNIDFSLMATISGAISISGIAYKNNAQEASFYATADPMASDFDLDTKGSIDSAINSGAITLKFNDISDSALINTGSNYNITGGIYIGGITAENESIISNSFNIGDLSNSTMLSTNIYSILGGISSIQMGEYASIINSANDGAIRNVNMSQTGIIFAGGVVGRNDVSYKSSTYVSGGASQYIIFTINYGLVEAFTGTTNPQFSATSLGDVYSSAAGILGGGLCNIINVTNYGNVYGSQLIGGIIGITDFSTFASEVNSSNVVSIANCMNYASASEIPHMVSVDGHAYQIYYIEAFTLESSRATTLVYTETPSAVDFAYNGAVIAVINFANSANAQYINIRYLISFSTTVETFRLQINVPSGVTGATTTMYSSKTNQTYLNSALVYSPLTADEDEYGNVGVFNSNFAFRKVIEGKTSLDVENYPTDAFLTDYFQFVGFTKVNSTLLETIGWSAIAYENAAESLAQNLNQIVTILESYNDYDSAAFEELVEKALNTSTWISNCDTTVLNQLLAEILESQDLASLKAITNYLFFESTNSNTITVSMRETFANYLANNFETSGIDLREFIDAMMTSDIMAEIIAGSDINYAEIKELLEEDINDMSASTLLKLCYDYLELLNDSTTYDLMFGTTYSSKYASEKIELLTTILTDIDTSILQDIISTLDTTSGVSASYMYNLALSSLSQTQLNLLYQNMIADLVSNSSSVATNAMEALTELLTTVDSNSYTEEADTTVIDTFASSVSTNAKKVELWNIIKNDNKVTTWLDNYYASNDNYVIDANTGIKHTGILAKATEYRNTYQSNDSPSKYTWTYNSTTGISTTTQGTNDPSLGKFFSTSNNQAQTTRFIYTPDEWVTDGSTQYSYKYNGTTYSATPITYFYGPYLSTTVNSDYTGQLWNYSATEGAVAVGRNVNLNTSTTSDSITMYVPYFCSLDESFVNAEIAKTAYGSLGVEGVSTSYPFVWNSIGNGNTATQWVSKDIMTTAPGDSVYLQKKDSVTYNGKTYNYNYDLMSSTSYNNLVSMGLTYVNTNNNDMDKSTLLYGYTTCSILTGIYGMFDQWGTNGIFFTSKTSYNKYGIVTTSYIDYTISDLVNLDGVLTKGKSTGIESEDEIEIIVRVMNTLLSTEAGKSVVMTALGEALLSGACSSASLANTYLTALYQNKTYVAAFLNQIPFTTSTYDEPISITVDGTTYTTVASYLSYIYSTISTSYLQQIVGYSVDNIGNFKKVLNYLLDSSSGYYSYIESLTESDISYYTWLSNCYSGSGDYEKTDLIAMMALINANQSADDASITTILTNAGYDGSTILSLFGSYTNALTYYLRFASYYEFFKDSGAYSDETYNTTNMALLLSYIVDNVSSSSLASDIASVTDSEILAMLDDELPNSYNVSNTTSDGYTYGSGFKAIVDAIQYNSTYYRSALTPTQDSTITVTIDNSETELTVLARGTGNISINNESKALTTNAAEYTWTLDQGTYVISVSKGAYIYSIDTEYIESGTSSDMTVTTNTATFTMTNGTYVKGSTSYTGLKNYGLSSLTNYLSVTANTTITFTLPSSVTNKVVYIYGRRYSNNTTVTITPQSGTTRTISLNSSSVGEKSSNSISGQTFTLTFSRAAYIYAISFDSRDYYYQFEDMICLDDVYYPCYGRNNTAYTPVIEVSANSYSFDYKCDSALSQSSIQYREGSSAADKISLTATTTTTNYLDTDVSNGLTYLYVDNYLTIIDTVYEKTLTTSKSMDNYYSNITASDLTTAIANDYFKLSDNAVEAYIASKYLEYVGARYRMDITDLTGTITSDTSFASGNIILHSNATQSTTISTTASTSIAGMTYNKALILTKLTGTSITFTITSEDCYLYIMCVANANGKISVSDGTNVYYYTCDQSNGFMTIKLPNAGNYTINTVDTSIYIYDLYVVDSTKEASVLPELYANTASKGSYLLQIFDNYSNLAKYYTRYQIFNESTNISTSDFDYDDVVKLLYSTITTDMELYNALTDEQVLELFKKLFGYSDEFLMSSINDSTLQFITSDYLIHEISALCQANPAFLVDVFNMANIDSSNIKDSSNNYYDWVMKLVAAYVGTDLIDAINNEEMTSSEMYTILDDLENTTTFANTNFIAGDTTIDSEKYQNLMRVLGVDSSTSGYGIYALASSRGIQNGTFIPDNLALSTMDKWYEYDSTTNTYVLIDEDDEKSASWRGGTSTDSEDDSDTTSVNYAFYDEMKQLVKSISTVVFELSLYDSTTGYTYYTLESQIDYTDKTITFYIPTGTSVSSNLTITNFVIADNATAYLLSGTTIGAQLYTSTYTQGSTTYTNGSKIRVYAEDTTVYADYTIEFVEADFSFDLSIDSASDSTVSTSDGALVVNLTSPSASDSSGIKLPQGMNIYPYITIYNSNNAAVNDAFTLNEDAVIDSNGNAVLDMVISSSLPAGTYTLTVNIYGVSKSITFTKEASSDSTFLTFEFEGTDIASTMNSAKSFTSYIEWGRAYDYLSLSDLDDTNFYLGEIKAALGATIEIISVTKNISNEIMTYTIMYLVTAEDSDTTTYTHYLVETQPYSTNGAYATVYKDGSAVDTKTWSTTNTISQEFNRGSQPLYRVKYNLNNFYTAGIGETYDITRDVNEYVTAETVTNGMTIKITNSADAGSYSFNYVYTNVGVWADNEEYSRIYTFPTVTIVKNYATNSLLDGITFINSNKKTGSLATVINPDHPLRPDSKDTDGNDITSTFASGEVLYETLANESASQTVTVDDSGNISYVNSSSSTDYSNYKDYYIIGSVSNATLSSYAPSFDIDEFAEIYQYTTVAKLTSYGAANNQTLSDETILENRDTILLYVPYENANGDITIFLVELDDNLAWTKAYKITYDGTEDSRTSTQVQFNTSTKVITSEGTTYTVADCAGKPDSTDSPNSSLYMNYYGDPLEYHFWYVSYIVFSEAAYNGEDSDGYKCYHVSIIDTNNTIQFSVIFDATGLASTEDLGDSLYVRFVYDYYDSNDKVVTGSMAFYLKLDTDSTSATYGMYILTEDIKLQMLPRAYYYLYVSLPSGYTATYEVTTAGKSNKNIDSNGDEINTDESGSYLPPATIVPQSITLTATITTTTETSGSGVWGIGTSTETEIVVTPAQ